LTKLNEVLMEVLSALELAESEEERLKLEQAAALLVQGGTPIGPDVLLAAAKCDEKNKGGETPLLSAVVDCSEAADCWELGVRCLARLVDAMDASYTAKIQIQEAIKECQEEAELARKKLHGARQNLALSMLAHKMEALQKELLAIPTMADLAGLSSCTEVLLRAAASVQSSPEVTEKLNLLMEDAWEPSGAKNVSELLTYIVVASVITAGSTPGMQAVRDAARLRLERLNRVGETGIDALGLATRHGYIVSQAFKISDPGEESASQTALALPAASNLLPYVVSCSEQQALNTHLIALVDEWFARPDPSAERVAYLIAAISMLLEAGADALTPKDSNPFTRAMEAIDEELLKAMAEHTRGLQQREMLDVLVQRLIAVHAVDDDVARRTGEIIAGILDTTLSSVDFDAVVMPAPGAQQAVAAAASALRKASPGKRFAKAVEYAKIAHAVKSRDDRVSEHAAALTSKGGELLRAACAGGESELVLQLLSHGADASTEPGLLQGYLASTTAAWRQFMRNGELSAAAGVKEDQIRVARSLVASGASLTEADTEGRVPICSSIDTENTELFMWALNEGAAAANPLCMHYVLSKMRWRFAPLLDGLSCRTL
jgi:hypothetical protein